MAAQKRAITRRDFVKRAAGIGAMGLGLASLDGFARLAEAIARRAGPRPGRGSGGVSPLHWSCPVDYCESGNPTEFTCASETHDCQMAYVHCADEVTCAAPAPDGFECFGPDAYGCHADRDFVCEVHFLCKGTDGGRFNCNGNKGHFFYCQLQFSCSPAAIYCDDYPYVQVDPPPPVPPP